MDIILISDYRFVRATMELNEGGGDQPIAVGREGKIMILTEKYYVF